jgi:ribosomal protein S18 acetylase RimI-like enzyme
MTEIAHKIDGYVIRLMAKDDLEIMLPDIMSFDGTLFGEEAYDLIFWIEIIEKFQHALTIYYNEQLVGMLFTISKKELFGEEYFDEIGNGLSYIITLGVHENHRNKGLASALLSILEQNLNPTSEYRNIILDVDKDNTKAINLYKKHGYNIVKDLDEEQYIMVKSV